MADAVDAGSFRDPKGRIYVSGDNVFRTVMPAGVKDYEFVRASGLVEKLVDAELLVGTKEVSPDILGSHAAGAVYLLEHPKLPFISYPYEWPFPGFESGGLTTTRCLSKSA